MAFSYEPYEPNLKEIASKFEELIKKGVQLKFKIMTELNEMVGWINNKNEAVIGTWNYDATGWTFQEWCKLNKIHLVAV